MWQALLPLLSDHHCITFNFPGAGPADPAAYDPQRHATLDGYAQTLLALVRQLNRPGLVLVGHSVSAMIGALAAVAQPQAFAERVLLCPSPSFLNDLPDYAGGFESDQIDGLLQGLADGHAAWSQAMAPVIMANPDRPALAARLAESFCEMDPTIALRWARATFLTDLRALLPQVKLPALVLQCRSDALAQPMISLWLLPAGDRQRLQDELRNARHSLDAMPGAVLQCQRSASGALTFPYASSRLLDLLGVTPGQARARGTVVLDALLPAAASAFEASLAAAEARQDASWQVLLQARRHPERSLEWVARRGRGAAADALWHGVLIDVSERERLQAELRVQVGTDELTRLPNRRGLMQQLQRCINGGRPGLQRAAV